MTMISLLSLGQLRDFTVVVGNNAKTHLSDRSAAFYENDLCCLAKIQWILR